MARFDSSAGDGLSAQLRQARAQALAQWQALGYDKNSTLGCDEVLKRAAAR